MLFNEIICLDVKGTRCAEQAVRAKKDEDGGITLDFYVLDCVDDAIDLLQKCQENKGQITKPSKRLKNFRHTLRTKKMKKTRFNTEGFGLVAPREALLIRTKIKNRTVNLEKIERVRNITAIPKDFESITEEKISESDTLTNLKNLVDTADMNFVRSDKYNLGEKLFFISRFLTEAALKKYARQENVPLFCLYSKHGNKELHLLDEQGDHKKGRHERFLFSSPLYYPAAALNLKQIEMSQQKSTFLDTNFMQQVGQNLNTLFYTS